MSVNKSKVNLTKNDRLLLMPKLNFGPTPIWTDHFVDIEWFNATKRIHRVEWPNVGKDINTGKGKNCQKLFCLRFQDLGLRDWMMKSNRNLKWH